MIWILLAALGIPIWLIIGILIGIWLTRRAFKQQPGVFVISVRDPSETKWPRTPSHARIVSDVLIINRGPALLRAEVHVIEAVSELDIGDGPKRPSSAVGRRVRFDDGSMRDVAISVADAARLDATATKQQSAS